MSGSFNIRHEDIAFFVLFCADPVAVGAVVLFI